MTTVPMPEPVTCWLDKTDFINKPCVTTTQAEAYKDACVREAIEEVLKLFGDMPDKGSGLMWTVLTNQIRALVSPTE